MTKYILPALIFIGCLLVGSYFQSCFDKTTIDKYKEELRVSQEVVKTTLAFTDSVNKESVRIFNIILDSTQNELENTKIISTRQARQLSIMRKKNDSLLTTVKSDTACNAACQNAVDVAFSYRNEADSALALVETSKKEYSILESRYAAMENFANSQKLRADSLEPIANKFINLAPPSDPDKLFGIIKLPSRTTSFLIGAIAVAVPSTIIIASGNN